MTQLAPELRSLYRGDAATKAAVLGTLDSRLRGAINLTAENQADLVVFLQSLTDPGARDLSHLIPASVPSGLPIQP